MRPPAEQGVGRAKPDCRPGLGDRLDRGAVTHQGLQAAPVVPLINPANQMHRVPLGELTDLVKGPDLITLGRRIRNAVRHIEDVHVGIAVRSCHSWKHSSVKSMWAVRKQGLAS